MPTAMHWDHWKTPSEMPSGNGSVLEGGYVRSGRWLKNERDRDQDQRGNRVPRLEPLFPIGGFGPASQCGHRTKIKRGSSFICMVCHQSGWEGHPDLMIDPSERLTPARPELATEHSEPVEDRAEVEAEQQWENLTRKQKRAIMFGSKEQSLVRPSDDANASPDPATRAAEFDNLIAPHLDPGVAADIAALLGGDLPV